MPDLFQGTTKWTSMSFDDLVQYALMDRDQTDFIAVGKFGRNLALAADTEEDIWTAGDTKAIVSTAETITITCADAADDLGSTGAQIVKVEGLDANYDIQEEFINLNGLTPVITTSTWRDVNRCTVVVAGTGQTNAGTITITNTSSAQTLAVVPANTGITQQSHYTVPAGYTGYLLSTEVSVFRSSGQGAKEAEVYGKFYNYAGNMTLTLGVVGVADNTVYRKFDVPARVPEKSIYWYSAVAQTNNTSASVRWNMILIKNTLLRNPP